MKNTLLWIIIISPVMLFAQVNLVPNPGFEDYNSCPVCCSGVGTEGSDIYLTEWFIPTGGSADYFNVCGDEASSGGVPYTYWWGYNPTHRCDGMAGAFTYLSGWREYIEIQLTEPLVAGTQYYVEFYAATCFYPDAGGAYDFIVATDEIGLCFTEEKIDDPFIYDALTDYIPQIENVEGNYLSDSSLWYKISGVYTALGGEEYITIGNFKSYEDTDYELMYGEEVGFTSLSGYVFFDDVLVTEYTGVEPTEPGDVILCEGQDVDLTAPYSAATYLWSTGATTQTINVDEEGAYTVEVDFECGIETYTFNVFVFPTDLISNYTEIYMCADELPITINGEPGNDTYEWNTGEFSDSLTITSGGLYIVTASNICNIQIDSFLIDAVDQTGINLFLGNDTLICTDEAWAVTLDATDDFDEYVWNNGESTQTITVTESGLYSITAENICGIWSDAILVEGGPILFKPELGDKVILCEEQGITEVTFTAQEQDCNYLWSTGETTQSITVHEPLIVWVECSNVCGKVRDTVGVQLCTWLYVPNAFSPNGDGVNDILSPVYYLNVNLISFVIYNRWGEIVFETTDITKGWDGTFNEKDAPLGTYVYVVQYDEYGFIDQKKGSITLVR